MSIIHLIFVCILLIFIKLRQGWMNLHIIWFLNMGFESFWLEFQLVDSMVWYASNIFHFIFFSCCVLIEENILRFISQCSIFVNRAVLYHTISTFRYYCTSNFYKKNSSFGICSIVNVMSIHITHKNSRFNGNEAKIKSKKLF